ncbi:MAG: hypothetical protein AAF485_07060, partial [Chloroflexota bacterium]
RQLVTYSEQQNLIELLLTIVQEDAPNHFADYQEMVMSQSTTPSMVASSEISHIPLETPDPKVELNSSTLGRPTLDPVEIKHIKMLLQEKTHYLYTLERQEAKFGTLKPLHIMVQIEDLKKEIANLKERLQT